MKNFLLQPSTLHDVCTNYSWLFLKCALRLHHYLGQNRFHPWPVVLFSPWCHLVFPVVISYQLPLPSLGYLHPWSIMHGLHRSSLSPTAFSVNIKNHVTVMSEKVEGILLGHTEFVDFLSFINYKVSLMVQLSLLVRIWLCWINVSGLGHVPISLYRLTAMSPK